MFRDTPDGLRTLRRKDGERVLDAAPSKRVRSVIAGTNYDGSYSFPVPLAGISWVDFDFRGTGSQLSAVFAGLFLGGNLSAQRGPKLRTSVETFLSALPTTDRIYSGNRELEDQQFRSFEQSAGGVVNWQASAGWTLSASSHVALLVYQRTGKTSEDYRVPGTALIARAWGEAKYTRKSFAFSGLVEPSVRALGVSPYGFDGEHMPSRLTLKYQAEVKRHVYTGKVARGGVSASYYGGTGLDRLSRYRSSFLMKPRILGIPNGVDAFDAIGLASAYYGFNVFEIVKLAAYYDHAWARNTDESTRFRQFDGLDLDIGTAGPWGTYVQASLNIALRGNTGRYASRWGGMIMFFKPMGR